MWLHAWEEQPSQCAAAAMPFGQPRRCPAPSSACLAPIPMPQNSAALRDADEFAGVAKEIARLRVGRLSGWASFCRAEDALYGSNDTNPRVQYADGPLARARACAPVLPATLSWPLSICLRTTSHACPPVGFLGIPAAGIPGHTGAGTGGGQECVQGPAGETPMRRHCCFLVLSGPASTAPVAARRAPPHVPALLWPDHHRAVCRLMRSRLLHALQLTL